MPLKGKLSRCPPILFPHPSISFPDRAKFLMIILISSAAGYNESHAVLSLPETHHGVIVVLQ
jgi:hypothetical protein